MHLPLTMQCVYSRETCQRRSRSYPSSDEKLWIETEYTKIIHAWTKKIENVHSRVRGSHAEKERPIQLQFPTTRSLPRSRSNILTFYRLSMPRRSNYIFSKPISLFAERTGMGRFAKTIFRFTIAAIFQETWLLLSVSWTFSISLANEPDFCKTASGCGKDATFPSRR
jgi:hypothetical protein